MDEVNNYGECCYKSTVKKFLSISDEDWLRKMDKNYKKVYAGPLSVAERNAWGDERAVLVSSLSKMPQLNSLHIVFEYVVPGYISKSENSEMKSNRRIDALLVGKTALLALEFKQVDRSNSFKVTQGTRQAKHYRKILHGYHIGSVGMRKRSLLVLTHAEGLYENICGKRVAMCSPDILPNLLGSYFTDTQAVRSITDWLHSGFSHNPKHPFDVKAA